mmetsp:Transcript_17195/g.40007  ORF Transcript_17195/g.40007 Transcript_17195/m.40007 type:complete len:202 (-) Transcript_17195:193-798(-)
MWMHHTLLPRLFLGRHLKRDSRTYARQQLGHRAASSTTPSGCHIFTHLLVQSHRTAEHELVQEGFISVRVQSKGTLKVLEMQWWNLRVQLCQLLQSMLEGHASRLCPYAVQLVLPELLKVIHNLTSQRTLVTKCLRQVAEIDSLFVEELLQVTANDLIHVSTYSVTAHSRSDFEHRHEVNRDLLNVQCASLDVLTMHLRSC